MTRPPTLERRAFLARGSACVAASFLLPGMGAERFGVFSGAGAAGGGLSVGYLVGSDQLPDPSDHVREWNASFVGESEDREPDACGAPTEVIAARLSRRGDRSFERLGVLLGLHGIHLPDGATGDAALRSCALHVMFAGAGSCDDPDRRSFLAWHLRTDGVPSCAPSSRCFIPLDPHGRIKLQVAWSPAGLARSAPEQLGELNLSATPRSDQLALRRGIYFVGLLAGRPPATEDLMAYQFSSAGDSRSSRVQLNRSGWLSTRRLLPVIPYLVLSVEYGGHTSRSAAEGRGEEFDV